MDIESHRCGRYLEHRFRQTWILYLTAFWNNSCTSEAWPRQRNYVDMAANGVDPRWKVSPNNTYIVRIVKQPIVNNPILRPCLALYCYQGSTGRWLSSRGSDKLHSLQRLLCYFRRRKMNWQLLRIIFTLCLLQSCDAKRVPKGGKWLHTVFYTFMLRA